ncbi:MAG: hypothetical protein Q8O09_05040 [Bacillota bacterium]|nr:hypothetical protein [Bacillota bacterium]
MGKDLRSFKSEKQNKAKDFDPEKAQKEHGEDVGTLREEMVKYEGKSEGELMAELKKKVKEGREEGTLSDEQLDSFYDKAAPILDDDMKKRLEELIRMMKEQ